MNILVIAPSWVGDMVMSQSLYSELKKLHPKASITVLAPKWAKPILDRMPEVDESLEMPLTHGEFNVGKRLNIGKQLKRYKFTHAYILPNSAKSALIPFFARIPKRTGWKGEFRYGLLNDLRKDKRIFQYMVERYVALAYPTESMREKVKLEQCAKPNLVVDEENKQRTLTNLGLSLNKEAVGICPGAEFGPAKRWPDKHYAQVAQKLLEDGKQVWIFGSENDRGVGQLIRDALPESLKPFCVNLAGRTKLTEALDLLSVCKTVVSNDSGLMHISAAVGCNVVAIYGSSSPNYTPPLTHKLQIVHTSEECRPCFKRECPLGHLNCLNKLPPAKVIDAVNCFERKT
ncbi:lipopolysaccharide heptosyltransferase II [Vibrio sp. S4M6]|uniref:lipopolysaccharide heptosyltransferase II n=1 Tax=Vibrio sinus TaxID=2946865 RepID=UPI00202A02E1|nr:lipopolysaccharide heptosyltransferase II [Vibrio sinus]MCL9780365.1 lipopolysaccharide heptosyltransferase II [Vibrio sinus]